MSLLAWAVLIFVPLNLVALPCNDLLAHLKPIVVPKDATIFQRTSAANKDEMIATLMVAIQTEGIDKPLDLHGNSNLLANAVQFLNLLGAPPHRYQIHLEHRLHSFLNALSEIQGPAGGEILLPRHGDLMAAVDGDLVKLKELRQLWTQRDNEMRLLNKALRETEFGRGAIEHSRLFEVKTALMNSEFSPEIPSALRETVADSLDAGLLIAIELRNSQLVHMFIEKQLQFGRYLAVGAALALLNHDQLLLDLARIALADALVEYPRTYLLDVYSLPFAVYLLGSVGDNGALQANARMFMNQLYSAVIPLYKSGAHPSALHMLRVMKSLIDEPTNWPPENLRLLRHLGLRSRYEQANTRSFLTDAFALQDRVRSMFSLGDMTDQSWARRIIATDFTGMSREAVQANLNPVSPAAPSVFLRSTAARLRKAGQASLAFDLLTFAAHREEFRNE